MDNNNGIYSSCKNGWKWNPDFFLRMCLLSCLVMVLFFRFSLFLMYSAVLLPNGAARSICLIQTDTSMVKLRMHVEVWTTIMFENLIVTHVTYAEELVQDSNRTHLMFVTLCVAKAPPFQRTLSLRLHPKPVQVSLGCVIRTCLIVPDSTSK